MASYKLNQKGAIFALALIALTAILVITVILVTNSFTFKQNSRYSLSNLEANTLAEAGIDKAVVSLNSLGSNYNGENETVLGSGSFSVEITSKDAGTSIIKSTGYVPNKTNPKSKRTIEIQVSKGVGISFVYGMLVGNGGVSMGNGSTINGSIYSNGNIIGGNNELFTGDVFVAGGLQPVADQENNCNGVNCDPNSFILGKVVSGNSQIDVAQSFQPTTSAVINKVSLKLKKFGSPPNLTIRLLTDNNGKPNKDNVLASGTLFANLVTNQFGFVDVAFTNPPMLVSNNRYWVMIDTSADNSNYWVWSNDTLGGYTRGFPMYSPNWQANNPVWNNINGDLDFKVWLGGVETSITMGNGSLVKGNVHAHTIRGLTINKDAYYQIISNSTVKGSSYPNSADPATVEMPISESNIEMWQSDAAALGLIGTGISGCPAKLGPGKIEGNVVISNNCTVTVTTPIWITGNLDFGNSAVFQMDPALGASSGVVIVKGTTNFQNSDNLLGTGVEGSYLTLLSTYNSQTQGGIAINTGNSSITGILYAPYGRVSLSNNANFKEVVAWQIDMGTGTVLTYDTGLINTFFSAGPGGSFSVIKGTYQLR